MDILNKKQKILLIIIVGCILIFVGYYITNKVSKLEYMEIETEDNNSVNSIVAEDIDSILEEIEEEKNIAVHITGAVKKQGVVNLKEGARILDAIDSCGGTTKEADLSKINLAYVLKDGQKIYVPSTKDSEEINTITEDAGINVIKDGENTNTRQEKININKASQTELETLTGIGPSTALKIINYRKENGNFKSINDIKSVPGIGESKFENIKNDICI